MCRPYEETGAFRNIGRGRSQTGPQAATWGRPYWVTFSQRKAFGRPQGSPLRISQNGGRVWDPPLQKTKQFRACRRGRTLAGPPGNGTRLGRAAQCAAPTKKRERSEISVGAGPRPARGRPHGAARYGDSAPVPLVRQTQAQAWNRTSGNFCKPRAQWPGGNLEGRSGFARRKFFA